MKAITITSENKTNNPNLFKGAIGSTKTFDSMPKVYYREANKPTYGYNFRTEWHEQDGFKPVVKPVAGVDYDEATQKLGDIFDNGSNFTYPVIDLSQAEIDAMELQEENTTAGNLESNRQLDGEEEARYIFKELRRLNNKGTLTENQFKSAQNLLFDALLPMTYGLWDITKTRLDALAIPANATLANILTNIKDRIDYYIANDIRQDE